MNSEEHNQTGACGTKSPVGDNSVINDAQEVELYTSFDSMGLSQNLLRGVYSYGWEKPTLIQQQATVPIIHGRDVVAQAAAGRGKTGAFAVGALQIVDCDVHHPQVLLLAPTRCLARQIYDVITPLTEWMDGCEVKLCVGGTRVADDKKDFRTKRPQVIIGTPGRITHLLRPDHYGNPPVFRTNGLKLMILDEADEMLSRGFADAMQDIFEVMPHDIQVGLFSATLPPECLDLTKRFMRNPVQILVEATKLNVQALAQFYVDVEREEYKYPTITDLYNCISVGKAIIFCNRKSTIDWLAARMNEDDFTVSCIHADMSQEERDLRIKEFRSGASRVLLATDLIGRGMDIKEVSLVINYDLPSGRDYIEQYLHRVGRTARNGKSGCAINLITDDRRDRGVMHGIMDHYEMQISELPGDLAAIGL